MGLPRRVFGEVFEVGMLALMGLVGAAGLAGEWRLARELMGM